MLGPQDRHTMKIRAYYNSLYNLSLGKQDELAC